MAYPLRREKWTPTAPPTATTEAVQSKKLKMADPADEGITVTKEIEGKYSKKVTAHCLKVIGPKFEGAPLELLTASLAKSTWAKHNSALNCIEKFANCNGLKVTYPMSLDFLTNFACWALLEKNLKPQTVLSYIASVKAAHKFRGLECNCDDYVLKSIVRGAENMNMYEIMSKSVRKVMTLPLLKIIGHQLSKLQWSTDSKQVVWSACVIAFFGSLRLGEILAQNDCEFNSKETLLWSDVKFRKDNSLLIHIKIDKSRNKNGSYVDLFEFKGHGCCPISVLKKLQEFRNNPNSPVFQFKNGKLLTSLLLNRIVRDLLKPIIGKAAELISGHSFRAGVASAMASDPEAAKDRDIKCWGRWSSESYLLYTRLKLKQKKALFNKIRSVLEK